MNVARSSPSNSRRPRNTAYGISTGRLRNLDRRGLVVTLTAVCTLWLLVLPNLGVPPLWLDEAYTIGNSRISPLEIGRLNGGNMVGYYALVAPLAHSVQSEFWIRLPSAVAMTLAVPAFYALARLLLPRTHAAIAVGFFVLNPITLSIAREARSYSFAVLLACVSWWAFLRADDTQDGTKYRVGWVLATALGCYMHLLFILLVPAQLLTSWASGRRASRSSIGPFLLALGLATAPLAWFATHPEAREPSWIPTISWDQFRYITSTYFGADFGVAGLLVLTCFALAALTVTFTDGRWGTRPADRPLALMALTWFTVPLVLLTLISFARPLLIPRYLSMVLPATALLVGLGTQYVASRSRLAVSGVVFALALSFIPHSQLRTDDEDWRGLTACLLELPDQDAVVFPHPRLRTPVDVYLEWSDVVMRARPLSPADPFGTPETTYTEAEDLVLQLQQESGSVWVVHRASNAEASVGVIRGLEELGFAQLGEWTTGRGDLGVSRHERPGSVPAPRALDPC